MRWMRLVRTIGCVSVGLALASGSAAQQLRIGGPGTALQVNDWNWESGSYMAPLRAALQDAANFGTGGIVQNAIQTVPMSVVDATTLADIDIFVAPWWDDALTTPASESAIIDWFLNGGGLLLLDDDATHDRIAEVLGVPTSSPSTSTSLSNGGAPLFDGPFGIAADVQQVWSTGQLAAADVAARNGTVAATNADGQITAAVWEAGQYAPGAGALVIFSDVDMASSGAATYAPLDGNGIFTLNAVAFLVDQLCDVCLGADVAQVSASNGGTQILSVGGGAQRAGFFYLLLGSFTGTTPGIVVDGFPLPLNIDSYTVHTLTQPNTPPLGGSFGILDVQGEATASVTVPAGAPASLVGLQFDHAVVLIELLPNLVRIDAIGAAVPLQIVD